MKYPVYASIKEVLGDSVVLHTKPSLVCKRTCDVKVPISSLNPVSEDYLYVGLVDCKDDESECLNTFKLFDVPDLNLDLSSYTVESGRYVTCYVSEQDNFVYKLYRSTFAFERTISTYETLREKELHMMLGDISIVRIAGQFYIKQLKYSETFESLYCRLWGTNEYGHQAKGPYIPRDMDDVKMMAELLWACRPDGMYNTNIAIFARYHGVEPVKRLLECLVKEIPCDDLHVGNLAFIGVRPVIIDWAGNNMFGSVDITTNYLAKPRTERAIQKAKEILLNAPLQELQEYNAPIENYVADKLYSGSTPIDTGKVVFLQKHPELIDRGIVSEVEDSVYTLKNYYTSSAITTQMLDEMNMIDFITMLRKYWPVAFSIVDSMAPSPMSCSEAVEEILYASIENVDLITEFCCDFISPRKVPRKVKQDIVSLYYLLYK